MYLKKKKSVAIYSPLCVGLSFTADIRHSTYDHMPAGGSVCVRSRCPVRCSLPQTGWSLLLLPRADGPSHVLF